MEPANFIAIYMPMFMLFFVILPAQREKERFIIRKLKRKRGEFLMTNELIAEFIGKRCKLSTGSLGNSVVGVIIEIKDNWLLVETNKGKELLNADFVQSIKIIG